MKESKMKVVQLGVGAGLPVHSGDEFGGTEKGVYWVSHWLGYLGCQVYVIDIKGRAEQREERQKSLAKFYEVWHLPLRHNYNFPFWSRFFNYLLAMLHLLLFALPSSLILNRLFAREKIEVIHAYSNLPALAAIVVNKLRRNAAVIVYLESVAWGATKLSWRQRLPALFEILALKWSDHIIVEAPSLKRWLVSEFNLPPTKISQVYSGVAVDEIEQFLSHKAGPCRQSNTVPCVGRVSPRKNQFTAGKVIPKVMAAHPEFKFVFVGPTSTGKYLNSIKKFIADNELSPWVEFRGEVSKQELYDLYSEATLFLLPSLAESQGLVLVEAMAFGLPVIASTIEPFVDVVNREEGSAILVDPNDVDGMAAAIIRLLEDSSLRQSMSQKAKRVSRYFSWEQVASHTLALYKKLVQNEKKSLSEVGS